MKKLLACLLTLGALSSFADRTATQGYVVAKDEVVKTTLRTEIILTNEAAVASVKNYADDKAAAAKQAAISDIQTWATDVLKTNIIEQAKTDVGDTALTEAKAYTDARETAIMEATANDATTKANAAQAAAIATAAADATTKANAAESAAKEHANTKAGEALASAQADATAKANAAETAAKDHTNAKIGDLGSASNVVAYADAAKTEVLTGMAGVKTELEGKITAAQTAGETAAANVKSYVDGDFKSATLTAAQNTAEGLASAAETNAKNYTDSKIAGVYHFKGTCTYANLPNDAAVGDVWNVSDRDGNNYAWTGSAWDSLGGILDLSPYAQTSDVNTAIANAKTEAAADATSKANQALADAKTYANSASNNVLTAAYAADTALSNALTTAIGTAKSEAIATAASDATSKADAAQAAAESTATAKIGDIGSVTVKEYVDTAASTGATAASTALSNAVTDITAAIGAAQSAAVSTAAEDATSKANSAKSAAIETASADATSKASAARTAAENTAAADATSKANAAEANAKSYTDTKIGDLDGSANVVTKITEAKAAAITTAEEHADAVAQSKADDALSTAKDYADGKVSALNNTLTEAIGTAKSQAISSATSAVVGTASDASSANTVYGAKKLTAEAVEAATTLLNTSLAGKADTNDVKVLTSATASGDKAIAIGYGAKATAKDSVAFGNGAVATAQEAVQFGNGTNSTPNSIQVGDTVIAKDGKLINKALPQMIDVEHTEDPEILKIMADEGCTYTVIPTTTNLCPGAECHIRPTGTRNFTLFVPNEPAILEGLPLTIQANFPEGMKAVFKNGTQFTKLPIKIVLEQPYQKLGIFTSTVYDDGTDWTPVITNVNMRITDITNPRFVTDGGQHALEGTSLHCATEFKVAYPTQLSPLVVTTNDVMTAGADGKIAGTFYYYTPSYTGQATGIAIDGETQQTWFEIIYKTVNGDAAVVRKEVDLSTEE